MAALLRILTSYSDSAQNFGPESVQNFILGRRLVNGGYSGSINYVKNVNSLFVDLSQWVQKSRLLHGLLFWTLKKGLLFWMSHRKSTFLSIQKSLLFWTKNPGFSTRYEKSTFLDFPKFSEK